MRTLAIGDIHGCYDQLVRLMELVKLQPDDVVIGLGDYVDRGPNSCAVIDWLIACGQRQRLIALRGNHDIMMLKARESADRLKRWLKAGGDAALRSYSHLGDQGSLVDVPEAHWAFLEQTVRYYETPTHFFVHANVYADVPLDEQPDYMLFWERLEKPVRHESGKTMICGHSSQKSGEPLAFERTICIDTWACGDGWLTCLEVESGRYWQVNGQGDSRQDFLQMAD